MHIISCVDDKNGTFFNHRRQSRDREVVRCVREIVGQNPLWIHPYSKELFRDCSLNLRTDESFLSKAEQSEYCFVEGEKLLPYENHVQKLYLIRWNRTYPADRWLDLSFEHWKMMEVMDFPGNSHEKLTLEVFERA